MPPTQRDSATRARLIEYVRRGYGTVEALSAALDITDNAVRFHLGTLERLGLVHRNGTVREKSLGKPAVTYELTDLAEELQSRAYAPILTACVEELTARLPSPDVALFMQAVGDRLADNLPKLDGDLMSRVYGATEVLGALGGTVSVVEHSAGSLIQGHGCPLANTVARQPATCMVVKTLLERLLGVGVTELCDHTQRPCCRFLIPSDSLQSVA